MKEETELSAVVSAFQLDGEFVGGAPYGSGHINDSYCVECRAERGVVRSLLQRINGRVFKDPLSLMENVQRVTAHLAERVYGEADAERRVLRLIPARDGRGWHVDGAGDVWRAYRFIEGARTYDAVRSVKQAFEAAKAFGRFQKMLVDLPAPRLHDTIPDFHNTAKRYVTLERAIAEDAAGRAPLVKDEIDFARARAPIASVLQEAGLPERITHNDTKFNNVMLDDVTGEGICVVDLDTVMPGLVLHDFGDMVRTTTSPAEEDERDLSKVTMQFWMFEALLRGYLSTAGEFLTREEKELLVVASKVIVFEQGIRFLTDHLNGDTYYKVHREGHNLDRCRTQFTLLESIENQEPAMEGLLRAMMG